MNPTTCHQTLATALAILWLSPVAPAGEEPGPRPADTASARNDHQAPAARSTYQGWKSLCLANPLIELQVLPNPRSGIRLSRVVRVFSRFDP